MIAAKRFAGGDVILRAAIREQAGSIVKRLHREGKIENVGAGRASSRAVEEGSKEPDSRSWRGAQKSRRVPGVITSGPSTPEAERVFTIRNEEDAFALLENALSGAIAGEAPALVDFAGWPIIDVKLPNTPINSSMSPTMMEAFIELQTTIYRAHSLLTADSGDLRGLSKAEKERLEFRVKVSDGSSEYVAELAKSLKTIGLEVVNKMSPQEVLIAVLGVALIVGGVIAWEAWLSSRTEQRKAEIESDEKKAWLDAQKAQLSHDTKRYELLVNAIARQPILGDVEAAAEPARNQLIRSVGEERGGFIHGVPLEPDFASEVVSQRRQQGTPTTFSGIYRVARVDTTVPDGFRVSFTDIESGDEISASLQDALVSEDHRTAIREAEWSKRPLRVTLRARLLRSRFVDAVVLSTEPLAVRQSS